MANPAAAHPNTGPLSSSGEKSSRPEEPLHGGFTRFELELEVSFLIKAAFDSLYRD